MHTEIFLNLNRLLEKTNHHKNLKLLMIAIYKTKNLFNPSFIIGIFDEKTVPS